MARGTVVVKFFNEAIAHGNFAELFPVNRAGVKALCERTAAEQY
jgi:hypothetical protein